MTKKQIIKLIVKDGYVIEYKGELSDSMYALQNQTTAFFDVTNDLNIAYTAGYNLAIKKILNK